MIKPLNPPQSASYSPSNRSGLLGHCLSYHDYILNNCLVSYCNIYIYYLISNLYISKSIACKSRMQFVSRDTLMFYSAIKRKLI